MFSKKENSYRATNDSYMIKGRTDRYLELDALRGIAALMVVFFHFTMYRPQSQLGFKLGVTGVDLFFIISGFVIFMSLNKVKTSIDFIINRASRLYPTYWAAVTFTFVLKVAYSWIYKNQALDQQFLLQYLGNMTMFQYYLHIPNLDDPYWTMIIEMLFYIAILLFFQFKLLRYLTIIGIIISVSIVSITFIIKDPRVINIIFNRIPLLRFIPLFFAGIVFYKIHSSQTNLYENYAIILLCLLAQILLFKHAGGSPSFITQMEYAIMLAIYFILFILFVNNKLHFIVSKGTLFFGKISFALYLTHQGISVNFLLPKLLNNLHMNFWIAAIFIVLPITIGIASCITYFIEVPLSNKLKEKLRHILIHPKP